MPWLRRVPASLVLWWVSWLVMWALLVPQIVTFQDYHLDVAHHVCVAIARPAMVAANALYVVWMLRVWLAQAQLEEEQRESTP